MKKAGAPKLTANDILAIQQLNARFAMAFDDLLSDSAVAWASTFAPDGKFTLLDSNGTLQKEAKGTQKLIDLHGELALPTIRHWYSNLLIERDRGGARMQCYLISLDTKKRVIKRTATYRDRLAKINGRWKFKTRTVTLDAGSS
jgi:SnoaL-like protein